MQKKKLYMVWERVSDTYFSEVAGSMRQDGRTQSYIYDKKHAIRVLRDAEQFTREMLLSDDIPEEDKYLPEIKLKEIELAMVPIRDHTLAKTMAERERRGPLNETVINRYRYEQVRRFNDYIDFNLKLSSHWHNYIMENI